jgi:hypothetical protein
MLDTAEFWFGWRLVMVIWLPLIASAQSELALEHCRNL